jgi:hypothetical protein
LAAVVIEVTPDDAIGRRRFVAVSPDGVVELREFTAVEGEIGLDLDVDRAMHIGSLIEAIDLAAWRPGPIDEGTARTVEELFGHVTGRGLPPGGPAVVRFTGECIDCRPHPWHKRRCPLCDCGS